MGAAMNTGERVAQAFWAGAIVAVALFLWIYLGTPAHEGEPTRWSRLCAWFSDRYLAPKASSVYVASVPLATADEQTDEQTDPVSEAYDAIAYLRFDRTRAAIIDTLVRADWDVGAIRNAIKGDNGVIGAEVAAARQRLGVTPPPSRTLLVRDNGNPAREIAFE